MKREEVRNSQFAFKDYQKFVQKRFEVHLREIYSVIDQIADGEINLEEQVISMIKNLTVITSEAPHYLATFNWRLIRTIMTLGVFGWIVYSFGIFLKLFILPSNEIPEERVILLNLTFFITVSTILNYVLYYQRSPFNFYMYLLFPLYLWLQNVASKHVIQIGIKELMCGILILEEITISLLIVMIYEGIMYGVSPSLDLLV